MAEMCDDQVGLTSPAPGGRLLSTDREPSTAPQPQPQTTSKDRDTTVTIELEDPNVRPTGVS